MEMNERKWIRIKDVLVIYGFKKTSLFKLLKSQQIESKLLSPKIRIISTKSIDEYINSK
jgi:predicted DNA-binding transcriptional regulator AlpA